MILIIPTDTCYGLAGEFNEQDYLEIYRLKGRDFSKQLALLVEDFSDMKTYIDISDEQREFLRAYPHPWSFLGKKSDNFVLPSWMNTEQYQMLSLRVARVCLKDTLSEISPPYPSVSEGRIQYPLFLTSANLSGDPESHTLAEAKGVFPGVEGVDGGICDRPPSDIFSLGEGGELVYLRRSYH